MEKRRNAVASAPTKLILFGEHFVVYGAPGIAIPIGLRNYVEVELVSGEPGFELFWAGRRIGVDTEGVVGGDYGLRAFGAAYKFLLGRNLARDARFKAIVREGGACKGMGNSSSIGAALGLALAEAGGFGISNEDVFECAQCVDEVAHGGRPSGIDARTVVEGKIQKFVRRFSPDSFGFEEIVFELPDEYGFVVIDTFKGRRSTTGALVKTFGCSVGAPDGPKSISNEQRELITGPYVKMYNSVVEHIRGGNVRALGDSMNRNHELLLRRGVSTEDIEYVRRTCLDIGVFGVKISGAGGLGGAVLVLARDDDIEEIIDRIKGIGFNAFGVNVAEKGVCLE
ncbi:MAG: hypothetical protein ABIG39_03655 [Candidatus Micrarchaeota archaeon]